MRKKTVRKESGEFSVCDWCGGEIVRANFPIGEYDLHGHCTRNAIETALKTPVSKRLVAQATCYACAKSFPLASINYYGRCLKCETEHKVWRDLLKQERPKGGHA